MFVSQHGVICGTALFCVRTRFNVDRSPSGHQAVMTHTIMGFEQRSHISKSTRLSGGEGHHRVCKSSRLSSTDPRDGASPPQSRKCLVTGSVIMKGGFHQPCENNHNIPKWHRFPQTGPVGRSFSGKMAYMSVELSVRYARLQGEVEGSEASGVTVFNVHADIATCEPRKPIDAFDRLRTTIQLVRAAATWRPRIEEPNGKNNGRSTRVFWA